MTYLHGALGLLTLTGIAWAVSENRRAVRWRVPLAGLSLQFLVALLMLRVPQTRRLFTAMNDGVLALQNATDAGTAFVFGYLGGGALPFAETSAGSSLVLAFRSLPLIIVVSALTALLTYWRVLPAIVRTLSKLLEKTLGIGGAVSLAAAANIFVGMVEAPLFVRAYLAQLSRSELFMVMATGMATIAGTVLFIYTAMLGPVLPDAVGHLVTASIISAPAAIMMAWLMIPSTERGTGGALDEPMFAASGTMDAITQGTERGLALFLNVVAMLLVLVALVQLANSVLGVLPSVYGAPLSLERMLGWCMAPVAWLIGIPWIEAQSAGALLGIKTVLNELLAYQALVDLPAGTLSQRSVLIMSYALCGMANLGSVGIMIGGFTVLVPERRREVAALGLKSIVAGTLATCCTGAVVGIVM
jgi:concentrative nucleoside transporter, CNT family